MTNPFDELTEACEVTEVTETHEPQRERERAKYFVVSGVSFAANTLKELKDHLSKSPLDDQRIVKGLEIIPKTETVYKF